MYSRKEQSEESCQCKIDRNEVRTWTVKRTIIQITLGRTRIANSRLKVDLHREKNEYLSDKENAKKRVCAYGHQDNQDSWEGRLAEATIRSKLCRVTPRTCFLRSCELGWLYFGWLVFAGCESAGWPPSPWDLSWERSSSRPGSQYCFCNPAYACL